MTPEEMKSAWNYTRLASSRSDDMQDLRSYENFCRRQTSLDHLRKNYKQFVSLALGMLAFDLLFIWIDLIPNNWRLPMIVILDLYFGTCAVMDYWLYTKTGEIDVFRMTVREISVLAHKCRRRHHQFMLILVPFAIAIVYLLCVVFSNDSFQWGAVVGGIIGGTIGLMKYIRMMRDYRSISAENPDDSADC